MNSTDGNGRIVGMVLDGALVFGGSAAVIFGAWEVYPPAAWIVGGTIAACLGLFGSIGRAR